MMLAETIGLLRRYHGLRQREVCTRTGMSTSMMSEIERGQKKPTLEVIGRLADVYGIAPSELVYMAEALARPAGTPLAPMPHPKIAKMMIMHEAQLSVRTQ
jgi:transcriptional regulator with XRE-family HTH domain